MGLGVQYFFLSEGWLVGRVWEFGGLWNEMSWRRKPHIERINLAMIEQKEVMWLYAAEDAVLMLEVKPKQETRHSNTTINNVVLKRLISAEQVIERLSHAEKITPRAEG